MANVFDQLEVLETAVVIIAESHNPTILHPSFLSRHKIVPLSWKVNDENVICSLPVSRVEYENGFSIQAEPNKLQLRHVQLTTDPADSVLPDVAIRYLKALPEVKYTAIGLNLVSFYAKDQSLQYLVKRFMVDGPWNSDKNPVTGAGLRFEYPREQFRASFRLDLYERYQPPEPPQPGVLIKANYHCDILDDNKRLEQSIDVLDSYKQAINDAAEVISKLIG